MIPALKITCASCGHGTWWGREQLLARLQQSGKLRRADEADDAVIQELLKLVLPSWPCPNCQALALTMRSNDRGEDDDWGEARRCGHCKQLIPAERLELFPSTTSCVSCQRKGETGQNSGEREFCSHCGEVMVVRGSRGGGIARYELVCPRCRR